MSTPKIHSQRAIYLLGHYLKFGLEAAGYRWDGDNASEVEEIVDSILDATAERTPTAPTTDPLGRIADALERIADHLDNLTELGSDYEGNQVEALRINALK